LRTTFSSGLPFSSVRCLTHFFNLVIGFVTELQDKSSDFARQFCHLISF